MELNLNEEDVKQVILEWAEQNWSAQRFNTVSFRADYRTLMGATLCYEPPEVAAISEEIT